MQFGLTRVFQNMHISRDGILTNQQQLLSAFGGGLTTSVFSSPIELVMIQQQKYGHSIWKTLMNMIRNTGIQTITRGLFPTMCRESMFVTGLLGITPVVQEILEKQYHYTAVVASIHASVIGGIIAAVPSHPFDIIKTCMQSHIPSYSDSNKKYTSFSSTFLELYSEGGVRRFTNGIFWRTSSIVLTVYIVNECRIRLPNLLFNVRIENN